MKNVILNESGTLSSVSISKRNENTIEFIAILQEAARPNRNGRIYPKQVLEQALNAPYVQERLRTNSWFGEANHPIDTSLQRQMSIDLTNVAFIIKEIWWEGDLLKGRCETTNTSLGRDMRGLIEQGVQVAFSLRAQGNISQDSSGNVIVGSPLNICCYDWVVTPSHDKAFIERICEDTCISMFRVTKDKITQRVLFEAANLFEMGQLIDVENENSNEIIDYTNYTTKLKSVSEMYIPEENDELVSLGETVLIKNGNTTKKVLLEDYLVKDIRSKLKELGRGE